MNKPERLNAIMQTLLLTKASSVSDLSRQLKVSHMTVRRDLEVLQESEQVKILHGNVILHPKRNARDDDSYYSLIAAGAKHPDLKRKIGQLAASLIEPEDTLIIDCGSTTEYLARCLPEEISFTALSYALNIISSTVRRRNCISMFSGGVFHENTLMFESAEGLEVIRHFRATKAFVSASGVSAQLGVTCMNSYERQTKREMIRSSKRKILLVDSSKFGIIRADHFAELSEFDEVVTDGGIPREYVDTIQGMGITLRIA
ncbi:MAG TPA: DeoR/GlpR family DNA-binding transcription regulator [Spirochaetia bacterium]|nr:DeoR/GlpR family DNA-binding transcription regulator [Spirochaetia bacterium]